MFACAKTRRAKTSNLRLKLDLAKPQRNKHPITFGFE
jgi:hypothetical protein